MSFFDIFHKKRNTVVHIDDFLPKSLRIGSSIEFDKLEFSNMGLNSKFFFECYDNVVKSIGVYKISNVKHVNIYIESESGENSYLTLVYDEKNEVIEECRLFKPYDEVFPKSEDEWLYWIGNEKIQGIMNDEIFVIEDEPIEKIGEILFKLTKRIYPGFKGFDECNFNDKESCIETDLFFKISRDLELEYDNVIKKFDEKLSDVDWIIEIIKNEEDERTVEIYFVLSESDLDIEYTNYYKINDNSKYYEKIYTSRDTGNSDEIRAKNNMIFHREIEDEFFNEEYINITLNKSEEGSYISLDLGIPLSLNNLGKL